MARGRPRREAAIAAPPAPAPVKKIIKKRAAKKRPKAENNNKYFHRMMKAATTVNRRMTAETKKALKALQTTLLSREEDLKAGKGVAKDKGNEAEYEVEQILNARKHAGSLEYLTLWKGYRLADSTWESEANLANSKELIAEFYQLDPSKPGGPNYKGPDGSRNGPKTKTPKKSAASAKSTPRSVKSSARNAPKVVTPPVSGGENDTNGEEENEVDQED